MRIDPTLGTRADVAGRVAHRLEIGALDDDGLSGVVLVGVFARVAGIASDPDVLRLAREGR
jgi:hypothetical protein